jgi:hypothetical protein
MNDEEDQLTVLLQTGRLITYEYPFTLTILNNVPVARKEPP